MAQSPAVMHVLATFLSLLAIVAIVLRYQARRIKKAALSWDDYMILPALLFTLVTAICMYVGAAIGSLGRHTATDPTTGYLVFTNGTKVFLQVLYATQLTTTLTFGFTKLSVLLFYKRVFRGEFFNAVVWANIGIVSVWTSAFFFANLLQCYPIAVNWSEYGADPYQCINTNEMYLAQAWSDIFTDLAILAVPIPCIWALQMPAKHKFAVSGIFLLGLLTVGAGTAKLVVIKKVIDWSSSAYGNGDITWMQSPSIYWGMIESSLGIVGACLPLFRPLFHGASSRGFVRHLRSVALPSMHSKEVSKSSGGESGSIALHGASNGSSNGCKTAGSETLKASDKESRERRDEKGFGMASIDSFSDDYEMNEKADSRHEERRADDKV